MTKSHNKTKLSTASIAQATGHQMNKSPLSGMGNNPSKKMAKLDWAKLAANSNKPSWAK